LFLNISIAHSASILHARHALNSISGVFLKTSVFMRDKMKVMDS